jgi:hypothetical protein
MNGRSSRGNRGWRGVLVALSRCSCLALLIFQGCWTRSRRLDQPTPIRREDTVWIWSGGKGVRCHDVIMSPDSVTGIPISLPAGCDDCRYAIAMTNVDSIVVVRPGVTQYLTKYGASAAALYAFFRWYVFNPNVK